MKSILTTRIILFIAAVFAFIFLLALLPIRKWLLPHFDPITAGQLFHGTLAVMITVGGYLLAARLGILREGGFRGGRPSNYWMILLPLLYPGLLLLGNLRSCGDEYASLSGWVVIGIVLLRALMEEVLCRGLIQGYVEKHSPGASGWSIIIVSATAFALLHSVALLSNYHPIGVVNQVIFSFFMGLLLGAILLRTRSVWLVALAHGILNVLSKSCNSAPVVEETAVTGSYLEGIGGFILFSIPMFFITWLLMRTAPTGHRNKQETSPSH